MFSSVIGGEAAPEIAGPFLKPGGFRDPSHDVTMTIDWADTSGLGRVAGEPRPQIRGNGNLPASAGRSVWLGPYIDDALPKTDVVPLKFSKFAARSPAKAPIANMGSRPAGAFSRSMRNSSTVKIPLR